MATRLNPSTFGYQNFYSATLQADITAGSTTITLDTVPTPSAGILVIDPDSSTNREVILYTSKGATTVTCPADGRGYSGTSATSHLTGTQVIMAPVDKWFTAMASGELSNDPLRTELFFDYVASGCVWSGDSYGSTRNASMTSGVIYINGRRLTVSAVTSRSFTASKDTYVDASDNGDGTAALTYTEVSNNAASPALSSNNIRLGIIVTGASNIANVGSINQGQISKVLPIASSIPYAVTDSLGNLICPRDPNRRILGARQIVSNFAAGTTSDIVVTGLTLACIIPTGRRIKLSAHATNMSHASGTDTLKIRNGTTTAGTQIAQVNNVSDGTGNGIVAVTDDYSGSQSFCVTIQNGSANPTIGATSSQPAFLIVELV
jgi:hypothetical protein